MSANMTNLFELSLKQIKSLEIKKIDDSNFIVSQKDISLPGHLSLNKNENDDVVISIEVDVKDVTGLVDNDNDNDNEIQSIISRIHDENKKSPCRIYSSIDVSNKKKQIISMTYIDYTGVFKEEGRIEGLKGKDFIIIVLSLFNEIFNCIKFILNTLTTIALKTKNKNTRKPEVSGNEEQ